MDGAEESGGFFQQRHWPTDPAREFLHCVHAPLRPLLAPSRGSTSFPACLHIVTCALPNCGFSTKFTSSSRLRWPRILFHVFFFVGNFFREGHTKKTVPVYYNIFFRGLFLEEESGIKLLSSARKLPEADRDAAESAQKAGGTARLRLASHPLNFQRYLKYCDSIWTPPLSVHGWGLSHFALFIPPLIFTPLASISSSGAL